MLLCKVECRQIVIIKNNTVHPWIDWYGSLGSNGPQFRNPKKPNLQKAVSLSYYILKLMSSLPYKKQDK